MTLVFAPYARPARSLALAAPLAWLLLAGSEQRQHIVNVGSSDGSTKIGLVALDLPSHLSDHNSTDAE